MEPLRILHVHASLRSGGVAILLYNYYENMNHDLIAFDHIVHVPDKGMTELKFEKEGSIVYHLPRFNRLFDTFFKTRKIIKQGKYKIVHVHHTQKSFLQLLAAWSCGVPVRIAHSHTFYANDKGLTYCVNRLFSWLTTWFATDYFACSDLAGQYVYGKKTTSEKYKKIINAIDVEKYSFHPEIRNRIRSEWGLDGKYVIAHVGRLNRSKNPHRLLTIFSEVANRLDNAVLFWIGTGEMEGEIKEHITKLGLEDRVILAGESDRVNELLMGADFFLLPSLYEGLGIVLVEAQVSGLPCLASDVIPHEVKLTDCLEFLALSESDGTWADKILEMSTMQRRNCTYKIIEAGYDLQTNANDLQQWYLRKAGYYD